MTSCTKNVNSNTNRISKLQTVFSNTLSITRKSAQDKIPSLFYTFYVGVYVTKDVL